jgi:hypothetical protein
MSIKQMSNVWRLPAESTKTPADRLVLLALADIADDDGNCWPGTKYLAKKCGISRRTVQNSITRCVDEGLLKVEQRTEGDWKTGKNGREYPGRYFTNRYTLCLDSNGEGSAEIAIGSAKSALGSAEITHDPSPDPSCTHEDPLYPPKGGDQPPASKKQGSKSKRKTRPKDELAEPTAWTAGFMQRWQATAEELGYLAIPKPGSHSYYDTIWKLNNDLEHDQYFRENEEKLWQALPDVGAWFRKWKPTLAMVCFSHNKAGELNRECLIDGSYTDAELVAEREEKALQERLRREQQEKIQRDIQDMRAAQERQRQRAAEREAKG